MLLLGYSIPARDHVRRRRHEKSRLQAPGDVPPGLFFSGHSAPCFGGADGRAWLDKSHRGSAGAAETAGTQTERHGDRDIRRAAPNFTAPASRCVALPVCHDALFRASHHSAQLEIELTRRNIPFVKFGGLKFLEAAHIKDVMAFLRWAENPRDRVAGFRVIQLLPGVGPATAGRLLERLAETPNTVQAINDFHHPPSAGEYWRAFCETFGLVTGKAAGWPAELDLIRSWYEPHLADIDAGGGEGAVRMLCGGGGRDGGTGFKRAGSHATPDDHADS